MFWLSTIRVLGGTVRVSDALVGVPHQVPPPPLRFVNRVEELAAVGDMLGGGRRTAIAVLTGLPGVGKSALARQLVEVSRGAYPGGELFVDFGGGAGETAVGDALASCLRALGVADAVIPPGRAERAGLFRTRTSAAPMLVVLDDVTEPAQVRAFQPHAPGSAVLVTSNARLTELRLDGAGVVALEPLDDDAAATLLGELSGRRAEPDDLLALVRECGGLPVALRVAAARLARRSGLTVRALAEEIADARRAAFSVHGEDSVAAVFATSYRRLPAGAARLYRLLGAAPAVDYTVEVAAAVAGLDEDTCADQLDVVVESGLLPSETDGWFRPHTLVRRHARERAVAEETERDLAAAARRLVWFLVQRAALADLVINGTGRLRVTPVADVVGDRPNPFADRPAALDWLDAQRANLLAAVRAALDSGWNDLAWQLAECATALYANRRYLVDWTETSDLGATAAGLAGNAAAEARLRSYASRAWLDLNRPDRARAELDAAFALAPDDVRLRASLYEMDGRFHEAAGDHRRALVAFERSLALFESVDDRRGAASLTLFIGRALGELGEPERALSTLTVALRLLRAVDDTKMAGRALISLGRVHERLGGDGDAREAYTSAVETLSASGDLFHESWARDAFAALAERTGDVDAARVHVARMVEIHTRLGGPDVETVTRRLADLG